MSVIKTAKERWFAVAVTGVLLVCFFQAMRDSGSAPAVRNQLIGAWRPSGAIGGGVESVLSDLPAITRERRMVLNDDGSALFYPSGEKGEWYMGDARHFHLPRIFPPNPDVPGMAEGAREDNECEIASLSPTRLVVRQFDYEKDQVWERVEESPKSTVSK